jgi:hypothetical protein
VRQKIEVDKTKFHWDAEQSRLFAQAIHGHPTITVLWWRGLPYESLDVLYFGIGITARSGIDLPWM